MAEPPDLKALREALAFAATAALPFPHKATIIQALNDVIRSTERIVTEHDGAEHQQEAHWSPDDTQQLHSLLEQQAARSWQHADELLLRVASVLRRPPAQVRAKAVELGLGYAVDYRLSRRRDAAAAGTHTP